MLLERLEMENFKSFRGRHEVAFGPRLNCITGPNGSGTLVVHLLGSHPA
jgi:chromosome segregation ATPase